MFKNLYVSYVCVKVIFSHVCKVWHQIKTEEIIGTISHLSLSFSHQWANDIFFFWTKTSFHTIALGQNKVIVMEIYMTIFASRSVSFPPGAHQKTAPHNALNSIAPAWTEHQVHCNTTTTLMSSGHHTASSPARATISSLARFIIAAALLQKRRGRHHCCAPRTPLPSPANHYAAPLWTIDAICAALQCIPEHAVQETNYFDWPNDNQCFMWYQQRHYLCRSNDLSGWDFFLAQAGSSFPQLQLVGRSYDVAMPWWDNQNTPTQRVRPQPPRGSETHHWKKIRAPRTLYF